MSNKLVLQLLVVAAFAGTQIKAAVMGAVKAPNPVISIDQSINQSVYLKSDGNQVIMMQPGVSFDPLTYLTGSSNYLLISKNKNFNGSVLQITSDWAAGEPPYPIISISTCAVTTDSKGNITISLQPKPTPIIQYTLNNISIYSDSTQPSGLNAKALTPSPTPMPNPPTPMPIPTPMPKTMPTPPTPTPEPTPPIPTPMPTPPIPTPMPTPPIPTPMPIPLKPIPQGLPHLPQFIPTPTPAPAIPTPAPVLSTPPPKFIGQFSVNLVNQSSAPLDISDNTGKQYPTSQNQIQNINSVKTLKIKMSSSNRGYLQVNTPANGSIQVVECDTNDQLTSKYVLYYDPSSIKVPQILVYDNPNLMSSSGFILIMQENFLKQQILGQPGVYENGKRID